MTHGHPTQRLLSDKSEYFPPNQIFRHTQTVDEYSSSTVRLIAEEHQLGQTPVIHVGEHASAPTSQQDTDPAEATHESIAS